MSAPGPLQQIERPHDVWVATPLIGKPAVAVVRGAVAVKRQAGLHPILVKESAPVPVEQHSVGVDTYIKPGQRFDTRAKRRKSGAHPILSQQQRLTAVQYDP